MKAKKENVGNYKADGTRILVRILFLALPDDGQDNMQLDGENLLGLVHLYVGGFIIKFCQIRKKPGNKPYVKLPLNKSRESNNPSPVAFLGNKKLIQGVERTILKTWEDACLRRGEVNTSLTYIEVKEQTFDEAWEATL